MVRAEDILGMQFMNIILRVILDRTDLLKDNLFFFAMSLAENLEW